MVHLPVGVAGWTVFMTGLLIVAYRVHGIDAPRAWVEAVEHVFVFQRNVRFAGGCLFLVAFVLTMYTSFEGVIGTIALYCILFFYLLSLGMLLTQNHLRMLIVATGEASDAMIKYVSIGVTVCGLLLALVPWFY